MQGKQVVVTTAHRGVFYGTLEKREGDEITLTDARVCVYWSAATRGFVGLAASGPKDGSRVSPACPRMTLAGVTAILECSEQAIAQWSLDLWN